MKRQKLQDKGGRGKGKEGRKEGENVYVKVQKMVLRVNEWLRFHREMRNSK